MDFTIRGEYIDLLQLLKATSIAHSGGVASLLVEDGEVSVNGEVESRKRRKLRPGDVVEVMGRKISLK